ncbi:MAG: long-chain-fatty-acid--CoA ligase [Deltaproteobacteria bacterium]|nr:long-chain-fatty-acid--CoA ligase [Deltaproteobacteria bacterium]
MNLSRVISRGARYFPGKDAILFGQQRFTYEQLNERVGRVASYLGEQGISRGDRVAVYLDNRPEWIMIYYGIVRVGAVAVCISSAYRSSEVEHLVSDSGPGILVTSEALRSNIPELRNSSIKDLLILERDKILSTLGEEKKTKTTALGVQECDADDTCVHLYTGGTTGVPKGAMLTHKNLLYTSQNVCYHERMAPGDKLLCFMPLNHVFAGCHIMNSCFYSCATLVLHRGFEMEEIISSIKTNRVNRFYAVPTVYIRILNTPEFHKHLGSITYSFSAATSMPLKIVRQWKKTFGLDIHEAYGMTETSSLVTFNHMYRHKAGSVGTPAGVVEVRIVDGEGREVEKGGEGEIVIRGPNIMKGYFNRPEETLEAIRDGWLHSGDVGRLDEEGYLYIVDRIKDVIISGGLNVYPAEVEGILYTHEAVEECAVVGMKQDEYGETVTAFIKLKKGKAASEDALVRFCKERMASYKAPKRINFVNDLPKTPQGKILKRELRKSQKTL